MKDEYIHMRISQKDKKDIEKDAEREGFDSVSGYLLWLAKKNHRKSVKAG